MSGLGEDLRRWLPGLGLLAALAVAAVVLAGAVPGLGPLLLAVGLGAVVANGPGVPARAKPGVAGHELFLEVGIVLIGARLAVGDLLEVGPRLVLLAAGVVIGSILVVEALSRAVTDIDAPGGSLLAAGAGVCGVSAAAAVAGAIEVEEHHLAYAAATVVLYDAATIVAFPVIGSLLGLPERTFGVWAGLAMFSTGPATAAGFSVGPTAGEFATLAKIARNALIGVVVAGYAVVYGRSTGGTVGLVRTVYSSLPPFLAGFVAVVLVANLGVLPPTATARIGLAADAAFLLAFAGLGLSLSADAIRRTGLAPVAVVGASLLTMGSLSLLAALAWF